MARETSDIVLQSSDVTALMEYIEASDMIGEDRIVGLETIIPTLYKYYKENYTVIFLKSDGTPLELYETQTNPTLWSPGYTNKYYDDNQDLKICSFDVDEETRRREPWTGNTNYYKQNLDMFLSGGTFIAPSGNGMNYNYSSARVNGWGNNSFIDEYKDSQRLVVNSYNVSIDVTDIDKTEKEEIPTDVTEGQELPGLSESIDEANGVSSGAESSSAATSSSASSANSSQETAE